MPDISLSPDSRAEAVSRQRAALRALHRCDEAALARRLADDVRLSDEARQRVRARAGTLVSRLRAHSHGTSSEQLLNRYRLGTPEGLALLRLAEAFLRVPDAATSGELVRDKILSGDWASAPDRSGSMVLAGVQRALALSRAYLARTETPDTALTRLLAVGGDPVLRGSVTAAMGFMARRFVLGRSIEEAARRAAAEQPAFSHSFDMLGEAARTRADADRYLDAYRHAIDHVGTLAVARQFASHRRPTISVKLSALHPRYEPLQAERCLGVLGERLLDLAQAAAAAGVGLTVDAEESERLELSLDLIEHVMRAPQLAAWEGFGLAVQAYQKRAVGVIDWLDALARATRRSLSVRLVKGAYWDTEIKRTQEEGLDDYAVFTRKALTDVSYLACAKRMLDARGLYPAFATHNAHTVATLVEWAGERRDFEFQRLWGMGDGLYDDLVAREGFACRVYAPVGGHRDLLPYLVRRLLENGANSSFLHQLADAARGLDDLLADPVLKAEALLAQPVHPIPRPADLFGAHRKNARGFDFSDRDANAALLRRLAPIWSTAHEAAPLVGSQARGGEQRLVLDPSDRRRVVGHVIDAAASDVDRAVELADAAFPAWAATAVEARAAILDRAADHLEADRDAFIALCVREAGKTLGDAVAEVREAVDFCRYYAREACRAFAPCRLPGPTGESNVLALHGRGPIACISPWNFPLAIFMGQVTAALVAGNPVLAKPAPQTPLIAARAVTMLQAAGVPPGVLALLPGGVGVGQALVADPRLRGVAFTGSTVAARAIARALAAKDGPIVPLVAETGGINAMIVDSSALPEQVVADVLTSGFRSAGQRCSALRVLYLQAEIADAVIRMLGGAMAELVVADPARLDTDIGPLIDDAAKARVEAHLATGAGRILHRAPLDPACAVGNFVAPALVELDGGNRLAQEVFGPVVHVVRWSAGHLDAVVDEINATGYGLTLGVHSRIDRTVEAVRQRARVGNLYVNRSMIGALVGVQPFGGEGLSGTGPKAGGPRYVARFATERTVSIDTTAAGGNATLMSHADEAGLT
ncbi:MAG TPA: bifunctional proline dehydrogenase/L-glutamate gamma-semialdehyde dehydrogenase PutA [Vineibacter sp.]|nr:bifunctional proline dehydrogenase/L-glutamate gamma-semialdehyde dehydrogenase PutA [Vineibacter sp.]